MKQAHSLIIFFYNSFIEKLTFLPCLPLLADLEKKDKLVHSGGKSTLKCKKASSRNNLKEFMTKRASRSRFFSLQLSSLCLSIFDSGVYTWIDM